MHKIVRSVFQRINRVYAVRANVTIGRDVHIGIGSILEAPRKLVIGDGCYIGKYCTIECDGQVGRDVMIGNNVGLIGRYDHDFRCIGRTIRRSPWIGDSDYSGAGKGLTINVGDDVWIGYGSVVLSGVSIGRGSIVAAGSVITRDVPGYVIVAGNPAKQVAVRFAPEEIVEHERRLQTVLPTP